VDEALAALPLVYKNLGRLAGALRASGAETAVVNLAACARWTTRRAARRRRSSRGERSSRRTPFRKIDRANSNPPRRGPR
jgi:hypothetical protein